jgi:hypothetical protein
MWPSFRYEPECSPALVRSFRRPGLVSAALELRPLLEEVRLGRATTGPLPGRELPGEQSLGAAAVATDKSAEALFCHGGILVLSEDVLDLLGPGHESFGGPANHGLRELRGVASPLDLDPHSMQVIIARGLGQGLDRLAKLPELARGDGGQGELRRHHPRMLDGVVEAIQKLEIAWPVEGREEIDSRAGPLSVQAVEERPTLDASG